ncbi:MAG: DUF2339 domain-containing protein, partial [Muribaculaceae bacterium]|nr:DUF2339 domain-containing protein [Muribaculaceae bacterium]
RVEQIDNRLFDIKLLINRAIIKIEEITDRAEQQSDEPAQVEIAENENVADSEYLVSEKPQETIEDHYTVTFEDRDQTPIITTNIEDDSSSTLENDNSEIIEQSKQRRNIEKLVGENLFSKIGILALIVGIGFFVKFAIDNNWINETFRTILGVITGFGLWAIAYKLRDAYRNFSSVLAGGGFAICFVSIAIGYNFYKLMPSWLTFSFLVLLTAMMIVISVKFDRRELTIIAIIGGYVAPFMSAGENGSTVTLLAYTTILNAAMFLVCIKKNWWILPITGCLITWLIVAIAPYNADSRIIGFVFSTLFLIMFSLPLAMIMWRDIISPKLLYRLIFASAINIMAYTLFALSYIEDIDGLNNVKCIVPLIVAGLNAAIYYKFYRLPNRVLMQNILLGTVVIFTILSVAVQFSNPNIISIFFAVFTMALFEIYGRSMRKIFFVSGIILGVTTFIILCDQLSYNSVSQTYGHFSTLLLCGLCYFGIAVIVYRRSNAYNEFGSKPYNILLSVASYAATFLVVEATYMLVNILDTPQTGSNAASCMTLCCLLFMSIYFKGNIINRITIPVIALLSFVILNYIPDNRSLVGEILQWLSACLFICVIYDQAKEVLSNKHITDLPARNKYVAYYAIVSSIFVIAVVEFMLRSSSFPEYYSAGFSVALIINGALLLSIGMKHKNLTLRFIGLGMFGLLLLKLVIYDLWLLPMIGRILVFILLGAVLLILSFMYQRLRDKLFDKE